MAVLSNDMEVPANTKLSVLCDTHLITNVKSETFNLSRFFPLFQYPHGGVVSLVSEEGLVSQVANHKVMHVCTN